MDYDALMQRDRAQLKRDILRVLRGRPNQAAKKDDLGSLVLAALGVKGLRGEKSWRFVVHVNAARGYLSTSAPSWSTRRSGTSASGW